MELNENINLVIGQKVKLLPKEWFDKQELTIWDSVKFPKGYNNDWQSNLTGNQFFRYYLKIKNLTVKFFGNPFTITIDNKTIIVCSVELTYEQNGLTNELNILSCYLFPFETIDIPKEITDLILLATEKYKYLFKYNRCSGGGSGEIHLINNKSFIPCLIKDKFNIAIPWIYYGNIKKISINDFKTKVIDEGLFAENENFVGGTSCERYVKFAATEEELDKPFKW